MKVSKAMGLFFGQKVPLEEYSLARRYPSKSEPKIILDEHMCCILSVRVPQIVCTLYFDKTLTSTYRPLRTAKSFIHKVKLGTTKWPFAIGIRFTL